MKKIIRKFIKLLCTTFLNDCYIIITCTKEVDKTGQPLSWNADVNIKNMSDVKRVCEHIIAKYELTDQQSAAIEEVNHILTIKK